MDTITLSHLKAFTHKSTNDTPASESSAPIDTTSDTPTTTQDSDNMEAAHTAIGKILGNAGTKDTTVEKEIAPAVEEETIKKEHETREQEVIDRERHQHHYHTTVQPLADREVKETQHDHVEQPTEVRNINKDEEGADVKAAVDAERQAFHDKTIQGETTETKVDEGTVVGEQVHHHLHETIQPVIKKETVVPSVTHVTKPVKEIVEEETVNHGITRNDTIPIEEFRGKLSGEATAETKVEGLKGVEDI